MLAALDGPGRPTRRPPFELIVLHCCHSAGLETFLRLRGRTRWALGSAGWIQPQRLDSRVLVQAARKDTGRSLAEKLIASAAGASASMVLAHTETPHLDPFLSHFNAFADSLRYAIDIGQLKPSELGDLYEPSTSSRRHSVDLAALLRYASAAHWLPASARRHAQAAESALARCFVFGGQAVTLRFPWKIDAGDESWDAYLNTRFAQRSRWPKLVHMAKQRSQRPESLFLGWELERALVRGCDVER